MNQCLELHRQVDVSMSRDRVQGRRNFLRVISAAGLAAGGGTWTDTMTASANALRQRGKACILLWMQGGPSQFETFSPLPNHAHGGPTEPIATTVPGIRISQNLPHVAGVMDELSVIRSMTSKEGSHPRASFLLHTGYLPTASVKYPSLGSMVSHQIGDASHALPGFVRIGNRVRGGGNAGFLGVEFDPLVLGQAGRMPDNAQPTTSRSRYGRRLGLLDRLETKASPTDHEQEVADHKKLYDKASQMIMSRDMSTFDLDQESVAVRDAYGRTPFGSGCLLARRLVESGVTFVEVALGGWDTHADNFNRSEQLTGQLDQPMAQLVRDLKERGMLDDTLVIWMGEFGRTPRINPSTGRDHYPRAFSVALAGAGIRGGQVIGQTDEGGSTVTDRPVTVQDLFRTFCRCLDIDADHENMSGIGRPIRIVESGESVEELFS